MVRLKKIDFVALGLIALLSLAPLAIRTVLAIDNGPNAINVVGQLDGSGNPTYGQGTNNNGVRSDNLNQPFDVLIDTTDHRMFVADGYNNRVLVFNLNSSDVLVDYTADYVLGKPDFTSNGNEITQSSLAFPLQLAYDSTNKRLFVACLDGYRVLVYDLSGGITNGMNAAYVLGQVSFTGTSSGLSQSRIGAARGVAYDNANQRLYVSDDNNHRVLVFDVRPAGSPPSSLCGTSTTGIANTMNASCVLGQSNFTNNGHSATQSTFYSPQGLFYDSTNQRLFVGDTGNNRLLVFDLSGTISNAMNAANVIGQTDFTSTGTSSAQNRFNSSYDMAYSTASKLLFASDTVNNRLLIFNLTNGITNGMNASYVWGQSDFTGTTGALAQNRLSAPYGVALNSTNQHVYVTDASNARIMVFNGSTNSTPVVTLNSITTSTDGSGKINVSVNVTDADTNNVKLKVNYAPRVGSSCGDDETFTKATLSTTSGDTTGSFPPPPPIDNTAEYQIASPNGFLTTGGNTVTFKWTSASDVPTATGGYYCVQVIPNDGTADGTALNNSITADNTAPAVPGNLTVSARATTSLTLAFGAASSDSNFSNYKIYYKAGSSGVTTSDSVWNATNDANLGSASYGGATTTTITGLTINTQYVFNIWAYDTFGNIRPATELSSSTASPGSSRHSGGRDDEDSNPGLLQTIVNGSFCSRIAFKSFKEIGTFVNDTQRVSGRGAVQSASRLRLDFNDDGEFTVLDLVYFVICAEQR